MNFFKKLGNRNASRKAPFARSRCLALGMAFAYHGTHRCACGIESHSKSAPGENPLRSLLTALVVSLSALAAAEYVETAKIIVCRDYPNLDHFSHNILDFCAQV